MPNRLLCSVLDEMRKACETRNFSYLPGLIEEAQTMANRMESSLYDKADIRRLRERRRDLHEQVDKLKAQIRALEAQLRSLGALPPPGTDDDLWE